MAEPLKNYFDERVPRTISSQIASVWPDFRAPAFINAALEGYDDLSFMERGRHIGRALGRFLPGSYPEALEILLRSTGERSFGNGTEGGLASFFYLPHTHFVEEFGLYDFEISMKALHELTQRFTAEFSVRRFIDRYEPESLAVLHTWVDDPSPHVRRLVSEGTRPRLPWASRLSRFQEDPAAVLALLERLKDDPDEYVRRSVANNLNDIGKDHPEILIETARRWMPGASDDRRRLVQHALRSLVKQGQKDALAILGFGEQADVEIENVVLTPAEVLVGQKVTIEFGVRSRSTQSQSVLVDLIVHFVKANGRATPKVFKLKGVTLQPGQTTQFRKTVTLEHLTTRRPYPGKHVVEALVNGRVEPIGAFLVTER